MAGDAVNQIKDRLSIVDVVTGYVELAAAGKNLKGKSPFTSENTPSFFVSPDRGVFYCFSSNKGGDIFTFIQEVENVDFKGALKILADKAGIELVPEDPKKKSERDALYEVLQEATDYFQQCLEKNPEAVSYLKSRGVKPETIALWRVGYAPGPPTGGWRDLSEFLQKKGCSKDQLLKVGLIKGGGDGKEPYDVFRDRIMFPLFDANGRVVAYSGRLLTKDSEAPKYVNSPETSLYNKSELLYGYDKAKQTIRSLDFSVIVEGQFDVVMCHQSGYKNAVAVSGTAFTPHHISLLERFSSRAVLALDGDRAGVAAIKKSASLMLARGMDVKVALLPEGKDPADLAQENSSELKTAIGKSTHVIEFLLKVTKQSAKDDRSYAISVREEVMPFVAKIPSAIDREYFVGVVAENLDVPKDTVRQELQRWLQKENQETTDVEPVEEVGGSQVVDLDVSNIKERAQMLLEHLLFVFEVLEGDEYNKMSDIITKVTEKTLDQLREEIPNDRTSKLTFTVEQEVNKMTSGQKLDHTQHLTTQYLNNIFKVKVSECKEKISLAESKKDDAEVEQQIKLITQLQSQKNGYIEEVASLSDD